MSEKQIFIGPTKDEIIFFSAYYSKSMGHASIIT